MYQKIDINPEIYLKKSKISSRSKHKQRLSQFSTTIDTFKYFFIPRTIPVWNNLPAHVIEAPSLNSFKKELSKLKFQTSLLI